MSVITEYIDKLSESEKVIFARYDDIVHEEIPMREYYRHKNVNSFLAKVAEDTLRIQPYGHEFPQVMEDRLELTQRVIEVTRWAE